MAHEPGQVHRRIVEQRRNALQRGARPRTKRQTKAAAQRAAQDQARRERERAFWEQRLRPALLSAIAEKAKQQKTIRRPLITAVLETITGRDDDITTWCGPIAKLPTDPERHYLIQCNESGLHGSRLAR